MGFWPIEREASGGGRGPFVSRESALATTRAMGVLGKAVPPGRSSLRVVPVVFAASWTTLCVMGLVGRGGIASGVGEGTTWNDSEC